MCVVVMATCITWTSPIDSVYTTCAQKTGLLNWLSQSIDKGYLGLLSRGFIRPRLDWGETQTRLKDFRTKFIAMELTLFR